MFSVKTVVKKVTENVVSDSYTTGRINQLIRNDAETQNIKVTKIVWNKNHTARVEGKPTTQKKQKELLAEAQKGG